MMRRVLTLSGGLILLIALLVGVNAALAQARPRDSLASVQGASAQCPDCDCRGCRLARRGPTVWWKGLWSGPGAGTAPPVTGDRVWRTRLYRDCTLRANGCCPSGCDPASCEHRGNCAGCPRAQDCACPLKGSAGARTGPGATAVAPAAPTLPAPPAASRVPAPLPPRGG